MNHNEVKAFFKKRLEKQLSKVFTLLSIDESITTRVIYIAESKTLTTHIVIETYFGTRQFSIKVFDLNELGRTKPYNIYKDHKFAIEGTYKELGRTKPYNIYKDHKFAIEGTYKELEKLQLAIDTIMVLLLNKQLLIEKDEKNNKEIWRIHNK